MADGHSQSALKRFEELSSQVGTADNLKSVFAPPAVRLGSAVLPPPLPDTTARAALAAVAKV